MTETNYDSAVAIIGMSGRFPNAASVDQLWRNLIEGRPGLRAVSEEELKAAGVSPALMANPAYVRVAAPLDDIDLFDAAMFGFSRREAESTEPQHRLFLECSWEALESAGYPPNNTPGKVGVFAGCGYPAYMNHIAAKLATEAGGDLLVAIGNERDSLASTVSYKLDLRGPSMTVQTFCSTSLVAVHLAVQSLLTFESDLAIAGGVHIDLPQPIGYLHEEGGITTPDGTIRSFDAGARGTILGNGVAVVALKRMTEALADGDVIHAVILGSAVNNDGRACAGYTAPGVDGQAEVIELALGVADVKPETIGYVECHATGTMLGDSIELAAMGRVFQQPPATPCVLSSLKPSIGHLDRASGVTGLIRAALALRHRVLPGTPNFENPNPTLTTLQDRFRVLTEHQPWPEPGGHPRRAAVSSFGFGGTNAHVVLEEAPAAQPGPPRPGPHLLALSARDLKALYAAVEQLLRYLGEHRELQLADVAYTLQLSRTGFSVRWAVLCHDFDDALSALADPGRWIVGETDSNNALVALRVPDPQTVPQQWWRDLRAAVAELVPSGEHPSRTPDTEADGPYPALRALVAALTRLDVRLGEVTAQPAGQDVADRLAAEFGIAAAAGEQVSVELLVEPDEEQSAAEWLLTAVARLWQGGASPDWKALHRGRPRRVTLPTYPFQRRRYWIEPSHQEPAPAVSPGKTPDRSQWTYLASWRRHQEPVVDLPERVRAAGPWLVFTGEECGEQVVRQLADAGADVTAVRPGSAFARTETGDFVVRPDNPQDMRELLGALGFAPRTVVHAFSLLDTGPAGGTDPADRFDQAQLTGFHSVLALAGALADSGGSAPVDLVVVTGGAVGVVGSDLRRPEHATVLGLAPVLAQENPDLSCRQVDVDAWPDRGSEPNRTLANQILAEATTEPAGQVAWREGSRWVRCYEPQPVPPPALEHSPIPAGATVLITGGLGHVGFILARHLASTRGCRLVLTARSPLPPRQAWPELLAGPDAGQDVAARYVRNVVALEQAGAEVLAMSADVADRDQMAAVVQAARDRFGRIDAVIHGAGVQDGRFFGAAHALDRAACAEHFRAKVHGFLTLQQVLDGQTRTRITLSSLSAVLGGLGFGPYAAANAALDAYALAANTQSGGHWVTVNWDAWRVGADKAQKTSVSDFEIAAEEGVDVFERAVAATGQIGQIVVSTGALQPRLEQWVIRRTSHADASDDAGDAGQRDPRPALPNPYVPPAEGPETVLAEIWAAVLGLDRVGAEDDFYRLGGDSVTAIDLTARLRKRMQIAVPVTALLENPTVRQLAVRIAVLRGTAT